MGGGVWVRSDMDSGKKIRVFNFLKIGNIGINYSHIYLQFSSLFAPCKVSNDTSKVKLAILAFLYCREFVKNY